MAQFFLLLKAYSHSVGVHCTRDVFSNKWIEKSYDAFFWVWFLKLKEQNTQVNWNKDSVIQRWAEKRKKRKKTKKSKTDDKLNLLYFNWSNGEKQKQLSCVSYWLQVSCPKLFYREKSNKIVICPNRQATALIIL